MKTRLRGSMAQRVVDAGEVACTPQQIHREERWPALQHAGVTMSVRIPLMGIRLRDVRELSVGATIESVWPASEEVPLYAGGVALSWCEFDGAGQTMAVRMTRLG